MSEAWGTTGRVTLAGNDVYTIDSDGVRHWAGVVSESRRDSWTAGAAPATVGHWVDNLPSRDAAVMWVLRRTAPDVWRAERPVVWRVSWQERYRGWCAEGPKGLGGLNGYSHQYYRPDDLSTYIHPWRRAVTDARFYAGREYARAVR